jgi:KamA family protein
MSQNANEKKYVAYSLHNFRKIPQLSRLSEAQLFDLEVVGHVFPFKTNSYVVNELIDWEHYETDPIFILTFPQRGMLLPHHYEEMAAALRSGKSRAEIAAVANRIRTALNPHPAGQKNYNVPHLDGQPLTGLQHKYQETVLFFPKQGQTCHAYCTFCFRWPQFVGIDEWKFAMKEIDLVIEYLRRHPRVTDILFTGGDPMVMKPEILGGYINALLEANLPNLQTIRIGSKALAYWPYKFTSDPGADELLKVFENVRKSGKNLSFMAHFSHPRELQTEAVQTAIRRIIDTGAQIRTQSPILRHINNRPAVWAKMWREQVRLGCVPYYMFVVRDTGAQHFFGVPLSEAYRIYSEAYKQVSGIARTVRGPSMSCNPGKVLVSGVTTIHNERVFVLNMIQGRNPDWVNRPFFAKYDEKAIWLDDLRPAFGQEKFFFEDELRLLALARKNRTDSKVVAKPETVSVLSKS